MTRKVKPLILIGALLVIAGSSYCQTIPSSQSDSLNLVLEKYYELNLKVFQANSLSKDIDNIFDLFTDDFEYIHPHYGGTYSRQDLYDGYVHNQKNGGYDGSVVDIMIHNKIMGLNAIAVSKSFVTKKEGRSVAGEAQMTLFEFRNRKISRIYEYW